MVPDPAHCDRFLSCPRGHIELCDPGLVLDTGTGFCLLRGLVNCGQRELNFRDNQEELERRLAARIQALMAETRAREGCDGDDQGLRRRGCVPNAIKVARS